MGFDLGTSVRLINENLRSRGNEFSRYVLLGDPRHTIFDPPPCVPNDHMECADNTSDIPAALLPISHNVQHIVSPRDATWLRVSESQALVISYRGIGDHRHFESVVDALPIPRSPSVLQKLEWLRVIPKNARGLIRDWETSYTGASQQYPRAFLNTRAAHKYTDLWTRIERNWKSLRSQTMDSILASASEGMFPLTEMYSSSFRSTLYRLAESPCECGLPQTIKVLTFAFNSSISRDIYMCARCGVTQDVPHGQSLLFSVRYTSDSTLSAWFSIQGSIGAGTTEIGVVAIGTKDPVRIEGLLSDGQINVAGTIDFPPGGRPQNILKAFLMDDSDLFCLQRPLYVPQREAIT